MDAVGGRSLSDRREISLVGKALFFYGDHKVLGHLVLPDDSANPQPNPVLPLEAPFGLVGTELDLLQILLGCLLQPPRLWARCLASTGFRHTMRRWPG